VSIKNIIFDFGGVFINLDFSATIRAFKAAGIDNFDELYAKAKQDSLFDDFEVGKISAAEFRDHIRKFSEKFVSDEVIDHAWNSLLLDFPNERKEWLFRLKNKYRLFLLSNTNEIHVNAFEKILERDHGKNFLPDIFEKLYYSNRLGMRKPHAEIFSHVIKDNGLSLHETIFIDDTERHVKGAKEFGLKAYLLDLERQDVIGLTGKVLSSEM
jgi:FMN phosphatase YigB (HAD superfamily)